MKQLIVVCVAMFAFVWESAAQESEASVGIGAGLHPLSILTAGGQFFSLAMTPVVFSVPIVVDDNIRIEPDFGFTSFRREVESSTREASFVRLGGGVLLRLARYEQTWVYMGPKAGLFLVSSKSSSESSSVEINETDFFVSWNIGGEHAISPHFRLFGEVQVYYLSFGDPKVTFSPAQSFQTSSPDYSQTMLFTNLLLGARFFF